MTIANYIPELWDAALEVPYLKSLVYGQPGVANTKYEGRIRQMGDTVHVSSIGTPTIRKYTKGTPIEIEDVNTTGDALVIDQGDYYAFRVHDLDEVQAAGNFEDPAISQAGIGLRDVVDRYVAGLLLPGSHADNRLGRVTVADAEPEKATTGQVSAYQVLVKLAEKLNKKSVPTEGRYVVVPPEFISALLLDKRYTDLSASGSSESLRQGQVGLATGFDVLVSNNVPTVGGSGAAKDDLVIAAGVPGATSFASQLIEGEAMRDPNHFGDIVRGLNVYGAKVFRPEGIATATVTFAPPAAPAP